MTALTVRLPHSVHAKIRELAARDAISVNQFYELVGLPTIALGDQLGWPTGTQFEVLLGSALSNTSRPCAVITFDPEPVAGYFRIN